MIWLRQHIDTRKLIINDAKALVHTVADTVYLASPGLFQRYAQERPQSAVFAKEDKVTDWQRVQKRLEKLDLHRKQENGLNIWTCEVTGPRKSRRLHGYLLNDPLRLFNDVPMNNPLPHSVADDKLCSAAHGLNMKSWFSQATQRPRDRHTRMGGGLRPSFSET